jgi:hypothetical protein
MTSTRECGTPNSRARANSSTLNDTGCANGDGGGASCITNTAVRAQCIIQLNAHMSARACVCSPRAQTHGQRNRASAFACAKCAHACTRRLGGYQLDQLLGHVFGASPASTYCRRSHASRMRTPFLHEPVSNCNAVWPAVTAHSSNGGAGMCGKSEMLCCRNDNDRCTLGVAAR